MFRRRLINPKNGNKEEEKGSYIKYQLNLSKFLNLDLRLSLT
jgi:hypothetical protein